MNAEGYSNTGGLHRKPGWDASRYEPCVTDAAYIQMAEILETVELAVPQFTAYTGLKKYIGPSAKQKGKNLAQHPAEALEGLIQALVLKSAGESDLSRQTNEPTTLADMLEPDHAGLSPQPSVPLAAPMAATTQEPEGIG